MENTENIKEIKEKITVLLKNHGVTRAAIFGSAARGELTPKSDIDILIEIHEDASLLDIIRLKLILEDTIKRPVDLVEYSAIKSALKQIILREQIPIL